METVLAQRLEQPIVIAFERKSSRLTTLKKPAHQRNAMEKMRQQDAHIRTFIRNHVQHSTKSQITGSSFTIFIRKTSSL